MQIVRKETLERELRTGHGCYECIQTGMGREQW